MINKTIKYILICFLLVSFVDSVLAISVRQNDETHVSVVVIDPGHGGKDAGAAVGKAMEKDIVLDLALRLGESIQKKYPDIKVIYTRKTDVFIPLHERARIANKNKADLFISIHINGTDNNYAKGTETFVLGDHRSDDNFEVVKKENSVILLEDDYNTTYEGFDPNSSESYIMFANAQSEYFDQSVMFASEIQSQFRHIGRVDRSVKQAGFLVLRQAAMPSVLIEAGFISHPDERNYLVSTNGKTFLSEAIFKAFESYKRKIENKSSFAVKSENNEIRNQAPEKPEIESQRETDNNVVEVVSEKSEQKKPDIYFTVQIAASTKKLETVASNFKGLKNVFSIRNGNTYKYYAGKFDTVNIANAHHKSIKAKYPDAFVVAIENNQVISVKKAIEKM
jgi:N-acetylmuramoyl-L-alanine amidase